MRHKYLPIVFFMVWLTGCGSSEEDDLDEYIHQIKSKPPMPIGPMPSIESIPKFTYPENDERRNPFKPLPVANKMDISAPNTNRLKQPLEAFPLDALKFVGILKQGTVIWALIKQPSGLVSRVKNGNFMGQNYGELIQINDNALDIEETVQVGGKWEKRNIVIHLSTPE